MNGQLFGFVRFTNVNDVVKITKSVNSVRFRKNQDSDMGEWTEVRSRR